jgi:hypothetical protein
MLSIDIEIYHKNIYVLQYNINITLQNINMYDNYNAYIYIYIYIYIQNICIIRIS